MLKVRWFGHSMWRVSTDDVAIVTDPFDKIGYPMPDYLRADIILVSHDHHDHNNVDLVKGPAIILRKQGVREVDGVAIELIAVWHDDAEGAKRGVNHLMRFDIAGRRFVHCGDLGHIPEQSVLDRLGKVDVLMVPVGGVYTLDAQQAFELVSLIKPTLVFPMHYKTSTLEFQIDTVESYARMADNLQVIEDNTVTLDDGMFDSSKTILMGFK